MHSFGKRRRSRGRKSRKRSHKGSRRSRSRKSRRRSHRKLSDKSYKAKMQKFYDLSTKDMLKYCKRSEFSGKGGSKKCRSIKRRVNALDRQLGYPIIKPFKWPSLWGSKKGKGKKKSSWFW